MHPPVENAHSSSETELLTPREHEVLDLIGLGMTNREIACRLLLSEKTVKRHMTTVMRKLGVRNRVEAALLAERQKHF